MRAKKWFDTAASGVRHFGSEQPEAPVHWKEWPYAFNTVCFNCHVSQLNSNYDLANPNLWELLNKRIKHSLYMWASCEELKGKVTSTPELDCAEIG